LQVVQEDEVDGGYVATALGQGIVSAARQEELATARTGRSASNERHVATEVVIEATS
jgi:hypothetical protein